MLKNSITYERTKKAEQENLTKEIERRKSLEKNIKQCRNSEGG